MFQGGTSELCRVLGKARHFQGLFCDLILSLQSSWYSRLPALGYAKQRLGPETDICPLALELSNSFCIMFASPACRGPQGVTQSPWPVPLRRRLYRASLLPPASCPHWALTALTGAPSPPAPQKGPHRTWGPGLCRGPSGPAWPFPLQPHPQLTPHSFLLSPHRSLLLRPCSWPSILSPRLMVPPRPTPKESPSPSFLFWGLLRAQPDARTKDREFKHRNPRPVVLSNQRDQGPRDLMARVGCPAPAKPVPQRTSPELPALTGLQEQAQRAPTLALQ